MTLFSINLWDRSPDEPGAKYAGYVVVEADGADAAIGKARDIPGYPGGLAVTMPVSPEFLPHIRADEIGRMLSEVEALALTNRLHDVFESNCASLIWLSFSGPTKPNGDRFRGVLIMRAPTMDYALTSAWKKGINPGGEVVGIEIPASVAVRVEPGQIHRLLDRAEADALGTLLEAPAH